MKRKRTILALFLALVAFAAYAQNTYHGWTEPTDWAAQAGGATFHPWYAPNDPDSTIGQTIEHGRASGFSTAVYRPESYGAKYNVKTVKQAKANTAAIEALKAALPDTGGLMVPRDELYTWGPIVNPTRELFGTTRTIPFGIVGEAGGRATIVNLQPDQYAIAWQNSATAPQQDVDGHTPMLIDNLRVISQGGGVSLIGLGKLLEVKNLRVSRCHGTGILCSELYGGSITDTYAIANYGKGVDLDLCNALDIDLITRQNLDDGVEISNCQSLSGRIYAEGETGWGVDADSLSYSEIDIYVEANQWTWPFTVTADATSNDFTATAHGLGLRDIVQFTATTALPGGISAATNYYVAGTVTANTFQVSATENGAAVDLSSAGSGIVRCDPFDYGAQPQARFRNCQNLSLRGLYWQASGYGLDLDPVSFIGIRQQRDPDWPSGTKLALGDIADSDFFFNTFWTDGFRPTYAVLDTDSFQITCPVGMFNRTTTGGGGTAWIQMFGGVLDAVSISDGDWLDVTFDIELDAAAAAFYRANPKLPVMFVQLNNGVGSVFTTQPSEVCHHYQSVDTMRFHVRGQADNAGTGLVLYFFPTAIVTNDGNDADVPSEEIVIKVHNIAVHKVAQ